MAEKSELYRVYMQISAVESELREQQRPGQSVNLDTYMFKGWLMRLDEAMRLLQPLVPEFREDESESA